MGLFKQQLTSFVVFVGDAAASVFVLFLLRCVLHRGGGPAGTVLLLTQHIYKRPSK
jgi:hypothetical protein